MTKNTKKNDTALIGCGYLGTNIAKVLTKVKKIKLLFMMRIDLIRLFLKKGF